MTRFCTGRNANDCPLPLLPWACAVCVHWDFDGEGVAMSTFPKKGFRFYHKRVLSTEAFDGKTPQLFEVTRVAQGVVYYRPVYVYRNGDQTREQLGSPDYMPREKFCGIVAQMP